MDIKDWAKACNDAGLGVTIWRHTESYMSPNCWSVTINSERDGCKVEVTKRGETLDETIDQAWATFTKLCAVEPKYLQAVVTLQGETKLIAPSNVFEDTPF